MKIQTYEFNFKSANKYPLIASLKLQVEFRVL